MEYHKEIYLTGERSVSTIDRGNKPPIFRISLNVSSKPTEIWQDFFFSPIGSMRYPGKREFKFTGDTVVYEVLEDQIEEYFSTLVQYLKSTNKKFSEWSQEMIKEEAETEYARKQKEVELLKEAQRVDKLLGDLLSEYKSS